MALTPTRIRRYLLCEDDWAEFVSKHLFQHGHQFLVVQVLHAVEVIEVQEHDLSGMSRQEATDLFQTRSHLKKQTQIRNEKSWMSVERSTKEPSSLFQCGRLS